MIHTLVAKLNITDFNIIEYKIKLADLIQPFPDLPTSHDRYSTFTEKPKKLPTASAKSVTLP